MLVLQENKILSVIWLGMANKYLEHKEDSLFSKEFDYIWKFWKTGKFNV